MNEDEAFIRAIVDGPGDDLPRLVYADWLDDRSDPRGSYLRAEAEWAKPWHEGKQPEDSPTLRATAAALDPVWVARVSRPPKGVCFERVQFRYDRTKPATETAVDALANEFGVIFPPEYRAFLLNYNGGWNGPEGAEYDGAADEWWCSVEDAADLARQRYADTHESNRHCGLFPVAAVPYVHSGCVVLLGVGLVNAKTNKLYGGVYHASWGDDAWTDNGEFIEIENWNSKVAESLPKLFAEWEQGEIERTNWNQQFQKSE